jgi:D-xylose transport system permease protein
MSVVTEPPLEAEGPARDTVSAYARRWWTDVKSGELGSLPIVVGLIIIAVVFQSQNDRFLTASNFVNLILQTAPYAVIAMGVTFVLLLGEIDLSIGFVSGVGGVLTAILLTPDGNELPVVAVFALVFGAGLAIGTLHGLIITKIGVPSFVVTLAGLLAWNGVVLLLIGSRGTVILQNDTVIGLANDFLAPGAAWILAAVCVALYAGVQLVSLRSRQKAGLDVAPTVIVARRIAGLAVALGIVVAVCNQNRGLPYAAVVIAVLFVVLTYMLNRTKFVLTGGVLLLAVTVDSISRRGRAQSGRA